MYSKIAIICTCIILGLLSSETQAQHQDYQYSREVITDKPLWNSFELPTDIFEHLRSDYADIRLYTLTDRDTLEEPFLLEVVASKTQANKIPFELINQVKNQQSRFYTYRLNNVQQINSIELTFGKKNFDTRITLLGSNDNVNWLTVVENQRVLSMNTSAVNYSYTKLNFPAIEYKYVKIEVAGLEDLDLQSTYIINRHAPVVLLNECLPKFEEIKEEGELKKTVIMWEGLQVAPVSHIAIDVGTEVDYVRTIQGYYAYDSIITKDGSITYRYRDLFRSTISSFEPTQFQFSPVLVKRIKLEIYNQDNQPLKINKIQVKSNPVLVKTRLANLGKHWLVYNNEAATQPEYDLTKFQSKIPVQMPKATLGIEIVNPAYLAARNTIVEPVFQNKLWLWGLMILVMALLGWFTYKMMKQ